MKISNKIIALMISLIAIPSYAFAQKSKMYVGAEYTKNTIDTGVSVGTATLDEKDSGYSLFIGTEVDKNFDVEFSYNSFGEASVSGNNGSTFNVNGTAYEFTADGAKLAAKADSFGLALKPKVTLGQNVDLVGTLGYHKWESKLTASASNISGGSITEDGYDFFYGIGIKANFQNFSAGLGYNIYKLDSEDVKSWGLRAAYTF
jgi:hypothetical protein